MDSVFFKTWSHSFSAFELDHIVSFFYERGGRGVSHEEGGVPHEKGGRGREGSYLITLLLGAGSWISHEAHITLDIAGYS